MPKKKCEDQTDAETHEPGDKHERSTSNVSHMAKHGHPFGYLAGRLGEYFALYLIFIIQIVQF